ncbi:hypothetical protein Tco_0986317 [Tanacetum coccineum]
MFKLDLEPLAPRLLRNRDVHIEYLKYAQEQADILWGIVEQAKEKQPLDKELDFACKHTQRIQELLVYVRDTCPNVVKLNEKKVVVTPKNKVKKARFTEPLTSSSNNKHVESSKSSDSNTPVLSSTRLKCSTSKCGSKPTGNKRNDRISQTPSRNKKNKVEAQPRKVNKKNRVIEPICDDNIKHPKLNANSDLNCATCKKSLFDDIHDKCLLDFVKTVNSRRTFTIVGNSCPLTRITSANIVPPKQTAFHSVETQKPELKVNSRKPKNVKNIGYPDCSLLDSGITILQELWGMVTISWEMLLSQGYTTLGSGLQCMTPATSSLGLIPNPVLQKPFQEAAALRAAILADSPMSTSIHQDAPSSSTPSTQEQCPKISQGFEESPETPIFHDD